MLIVIKLSVAFTYCYAECCHSECRYADCLSVLQCCIAKHLHFQPFKFIMTIIIFLFNLLSITFTINLKLINYFNKIIQIGLNNIKYQTLHNGNKSV